MASPNISGVADPSPHRLGGINYSYNTASHHSRTVFGEQFRNKPATRAGAPEPPKRVVVEDGSDDKSQVFSLLGLTGGAQAPLDVIQRIVEKVLELDALEELVKLQASAPVTSGADMTSKHETRMYPHITSIMNVVAQAPVAGSRGRKFFCNGEKPVIFDLDETPARGLKPDMRCAIDDSDKPIWRLLDAWGEVKASSSEYPYREVTEDGRKSHVLTDFGTQATHYATMHLSGTPFRLFSFGLLIFGRKFCVVRFDRDGVIFSPIRDMKDDLKTFVRVYYAFVHAASPLALGLEPGVESIELPDIRGNLPPSKDGFDRHYRIPPIQGDDEKRWWISVGRPLWVSKSILGRCTSVWIVYPAKEDKGKLRVDPTRAYVLKNAWRNSAREPESSIYTWFMANGTIAGVSSLLVGSDVTGSDKAVVTARHLRGETDDVFTTTTTTTATLHRLILNEVGVPLWKFKTHLELLRGFKAALDGHAALFAKGMIHRDISAGNILLSEDPNVHGFLSDVEFAWVSQIAKAEPANAHDSVPENQNEYVQQYRAYNSRNPGVVPANIERPERHIFVDAKRGAEMTGTQLFMAVDILQAITLNAQLRHGVYHDIESFTYVLGYTVIRHYESDPKTDAVARKYLQKIYREAFGHVSVEAIERSRRAIDTAEHPLGWLSHPFKVVAGKIDEGIPKAPYVLFREWCEKTFAPPFLTLFADLRDMHIDASAARQKSKSDGELRGKLEEIFSYERLGGLLEKAIQGLEEAAE
ncbi:unnamed protein product [Peniophora sp. CBMAI 1063]|nr:unnamed protein product [Peniophora sp. CBMAI 1063]